MARIAYVNGRYQPIGAPAVRIEDRGYQFADGVYEVIKAVNGRLLDLDRHLARLDRSLGALDIRLPMTRPALAAVMAETVRRNRLPAAAVYLQVSRGVAPRDHRWAAGLKPSTVVTVRPLRLPTAREIEHGVGVVTLPDERWARCDIKSVGLLPNVLAKQRAVAAGCREAWMVDDAGRVTEGSSSNAWIVDGNGRLVTRPLGPEILGGVTREVVIELAERAGIAVIERPFSVEEALSAREAFLTSTTSLVLPVTEIDGRVVANGRPGSVTSRLAQLYAQRQGLSLPAGGAG